MTDAMKKLPRYSCHKEVRALKIARIQPQKDGSAMLTPSKADYAPFRVSAQYVTKHIRDTVMGSPRIGGYYVVYADGYESFSPALAFEEGYTLIE